MSKQQTIVVAGGGSGGHVYPIIEIVHELHSRNPLYTFDYIGQRGGPEYEIVGSADIPVRLPFHGITAEKLRRYWHWKTFVLPFAILSGTFQAFRLLLSIRPKVVLCKGGYVGVPVAIAAWLLNIPIVLHETDAIMGLANRLIAPFAGRIAVSFPRHNLLSDTRKGKMVYTGHPLHKDFFTKKKRTSSGRPHLVVTGGSQGSTAINTLVAQIIDDLLDRYEVTHITGKRDVGRMQSNCQHRNYHPLDYTHDMSDVLGSADLILSRAGGTIFEIAALGKPAILIPLPTAANDHQRANAEILSGNQAAVVLDEVTLTPEQLKQKIIDLMKDSQLRATLSENITQFARKDAASQVARLVEEAMGSS